MPSSPIDLERDRLRVIRELGTGVQGTVWLAELSHERYRLPAGHPVAVKVLRPELVADAKALRRFHKEAEIGGRIRHPNVMRILSLEERALELDASGEGGSSGRLVYLVMEYLEGQSLREFLETRGTAVEALVRRIGREAALGLDALHRHRIVHRDIKPENLCLTRQGETKLMDLGFAARGIVRGSGSSSYGGGVRGTLSYSAPEVLRGRPVTARGDLYSLGVVLYELATGRHPFVEAREADDLIQAHLTLSPPPPSASEPRLSAFLDKLLLEMLEKEPQDRPGSAARVARIFAEGERSTFWRTRERAAPALGSERRLRRSLRPAAAGLIGRKAQLNTLERALKDASRGRCRVLHLSGPEGIGKRRLIDEFVGKRLGAGDALCYYPGEPVPRSRAQPISPLSDFLIEHYCRDLPGEGGTASGRHLREKLAVRLESEAGLAEPQARVLASYLGESPDSQHEPPIELAALALRAMGRLGRPLVLRLHRAERLAPQTLRVLEALSELEAPSPVLLLLSSHRESRPADLGRLPFEELSLPYLSEKETGALLAALFASPEEAGRACELLLAHLTPLPGLLLESLEHLVQRGELRFARGRYAELAKEAEVPVQGQLRTFLLSSWRRLSDEQRRLLEAAAILGPRFRSRDLAALLREQELDILMLLSGLRGRWVLSAEEGLRFRRRSQRQMILEEVPLPERLDLHKRAAEMFEARGAEPVSIGMQWSRGGEHAKALPCLLAAASRSLDRGNPERAESLLGRARFHLNALPRTPENLNSRMRWLGQRAEIELLRGRPRKAQEQLETALPIAGVLGRKDWRARLTCSLARSAWDQGHPSQAMTLLDSALALFRPDEQAGEIVQALLVRTGYECEMGSLKEGLRSILRAQALLESGRDSLLAARVTQERAVIEAARLRVELAWRCFDEAKTLFSEHGDSQGLYMLRIKRSPLMLDTHGPRAARKELEEIAPRLANPRELCQALGWIAWTWHAEGRYTEALASILPALESAEEAGDAPALLALRLQELDSRSELGSGEPGVARELRESAEASTLPRLILHARRLEARLLGTQRRDEEALALLGLALDELRLYQLEPTLILGLLLEKAEAQDRLGLAEGRRTRNLARRSLARFARRIRRTAARQAFLRADPIRRRLA